MFSFQFARSPWKDHFQTADNVNLTFWPHYLYSFNAVKLPTFAVDFSTKHYFMLNVMFSLHFDVVSFVIIFYQHLDVGSRIQNLSISKRISLKPKMVIEFTRICVQFRIVSALFRSQTNIFRISHSPNVTQCFLG